MTCTEGADPYLALDLGQNTLLTQRRLSDDDETLTYQIYKDAARTTVWGPSGFDRLDPPSAASNAPRTFDAFGRILAGQSVPAGMYTDVVIAAIQF